MRISSSGLFSWTAVPSLSLSSSEAREEERREERGERALCVRHNSYLTPSSSVVRLPRMKHTLTSISWTERERERERINRLLAHSLCYCNFTARQEAVNISWRQYNAFRLAYILRRARKPKTSNTLLICCSRGGSDVESEHGGGEGGTRDKRRPPHSSLAAVSAYCTSIKQHTLSKKGTS